MSDHATTTASRDGTASAAKPNLVATVSTVVDAPRSRTWQALVDPAEIRAWMFGTEVSSDWKVGSPITWKGEWQGKAYEDHGRILRVEPGCLLSYSHFSPLAGQPDVPENHHTVTIELGDDGPSRTRVMLTQDNNPTAEAVEHSRKNWETALAALRKHVERRRDSVT